MAEFHRLQKCFFKKSTPESAESVGGRTHLRPRTDEAEVIYKNWLYNDKNLSVFTHSYNIFMTFFYLSF